MRLLRLQMASLRQEMDAPCLGNSARCGRSGWWSGAGGGRAEFSRTRDLEILESESQPESCNIVGNVEINSFLLPARGMV